MTKRKVMISEDRTEETIENLTNNDGDEEDDENEQQQPGEL